MRKRDATGVGVVRDSAPGFEVPPGRGSDLKSASKVLVKEAGGGGRAQAFMTMMLWCRCVPLQVQCGVHALPPILCLCMLRCYVACTQPCMSAG